MHISRKCQYALLALLELAAERGEGSLSVAELTERQSLPPKFLERILSELRQGGFVLSRRGSRGGYRLAVAAEELSVGEVITFVDGPLLPSADDESPLSGLWSEVRQTVRDIYDRTTLADLAETYRRDRERRENTPNYCI